MRNPGRAVQDLTLCLLAATADCDSIIELGCGRGDRLALCQGKERLGIDAHLPYIEMAQARWGNRDGFLCENALTFCKSAYPAGRRWDAVLMIDFVEHLEKPDAQETIVLSKAMAYRRVIVFSPEGLSPQHEDVFGTGGGVWQTHRSQWTLEDLMSLGFDTSLWPDFHGKGRHALFGIWNQP